MCGKFCFPQPIGPWSLALGIQEVTVWRDQNFDQYHHWQNGKHDLKIKTNIDWVLFFWCKICSELPEYSDKVYKYRQQGGSFPWVFAQTTQNKCFPRKCTAAFYHWLVQTLFSKQTNYIFMRKTLAGQIILVPGVWPREGVQTLDPKAPH